MLAYMRYGIYDGKLGFQQIVLHTESGLNLRRHCSSFFLKTPAESAVTTSAGSFIPRANCWIKAHTSRGDIAALGKCKDTSKPNSIID